MTRSTCRGVAGAFGVVAEGVARSASADADGIPGHTLLQALADRTGTFTVVD
jgi:hypothetical protein